MCSRWRLCVGQRKAPAGEITKSCWVAKYLNRSIPDLDGDCSSLDGSDDPDLRAVGGHGQHVLSHERSLRDHVRFVGARTHPHLMGSASLLRQDGFGGGWRVSTLLIGPGEVSRQTVRPLVVGRRGQLMGCRAPVGVVSTWTIRSLSSPRCRCRGWADECPKGTEGDGGAVRG
jgi:hypothetical protein